MSTLFTIGYSDFLDNIAEEVRLARHVRYIKTPSGRTLYMPVTRADDAEEIEEIKRLISSANAVKSGACPNLQDHRLEPDDDWEARGVIEHRGVGE